MKKKCMDCKERDVVQEDLCAECWERLYGALTGIFLGG